MNRTTTWSTLSEVSNVVTILGFLIEVAPIIAPSICIFGNVILLHQFARASARKLQSCYLKICFSHSVAYIIGEAKIVPT